MNPHSTVAQERLLRAAELYEREYVPTVARPMAYGLMSEAQPRSHEQVLDVACGTGIAARIAAEAVIDLGNVTGLDTSPMMLEVAAAHAPAGINWVQGSAEDIPLPDDSFTLVLCLQGLQHFGNRPRALAEIRRVLAPGGRFASLTPGPTSPLMQAMADALGEHVGPAASGYIDRVSELGDPAAVASLFDAAGFHGVRTTKSHVALTVPPPLHTFDLYVAATPLAPMVAALDEAHREQLRQDFASRCALLPDPTELRIDYVVGLGSKA